MLGGAFISWASFLLPDLLAVLGVLFGLGCFFSGIILARERFLDAAA